ncbi:MAG TPA: TonB-dependent receptor, partial [Urbifossiella sp.]
VVAPPAPRLTDGPPPVANLGTGDTNPTVPVAPAAVETSIPVAASQANQVLNATDLSQLLFNSSLSTGIQFQQRNPIVADPRIRGMKNSQYALYGDNAYFVPVRLDLDTPVTRFDPGSVRDVTLVKGPYSVMYGPAPAVLSVASLDSPRFADGYQMHGRTSLNYQTNGARWDGIQSLWAGDTNWGARLTYNGLTGNDYKSGNGTDVPSSYLSHNVNFALGWSPTDNSSLELKGQRVYQQNLEFPGLYFDVATLNTEAYSMRYMLKNQGIFDRMVVDTWFNGTTGTGNTSASAKQAFDQQLLAVSFNPGRFNQAGFAMNPQAGIAGNPLYAISSIAQASTTPGRPLNLFTDQSTSSFATTSLGYRLFGEWDHDNGGKLTVGTDMRVLGQGLQENINFTQTQGFNLNTGAAVTAPITYTQNQSIPNSNSVNPGLFAHNQASITDRLMFNVGGRVDWNRSSSNNRDITGNVNLFGNGPTVGPGGASTSLDPIIYSSNPSNPNLDRDFFLMSGYLQSQYKLTDELTGVASFGHSERAPTLTELYAAGPFVGVLQQGTSRLIGDPNLKSEKLNQFDLGVQADYGWFKGGASAFYGWVNDYITFDQNKSGPGLTQVVYTNTNLATLAGAEMFGQMDLTAWLTAFGTMTYVQGVDQTHRDNNQPAGIASSRAYNPAAGQFATATEALPQIPPLESRIGLRVHDMSPQRKWQLEFSARMVAGQNNVASSLGELATPGFTTFNIRGYWAATERLLLTAGVENLGNKNYREHLDPISGNIVGVNPMYRPGTNFYFGSQLSY